MVHPLKSWRDAQKLTQPEAGERIGVDAMTVSRWERGAHLPHRKHWKRIEDATGISFAQLAQHLGESEAAQ